MQQPMSPEQMALLAQQWLGTSGYDANKAKENAKPQNQYWSPKNGSVVFRLLPPGPPGNALFSSGFWARKYFKFWIDVPSTKPTAGKDKDENRFALYDARRSCPGKFNDDPIGEAVAELESTIPSDVLMGMRSKARCLVNIYISEIYDERQNPIDRDFCNKVIIADMPIGFFDHLRKEVASPFGDYFNPFASLPMTMQKSGKGQKGTEYAYGVMPGAIRSPILSDIGQLQKLLTEVPDLDEVVLKNCQRDMDHARVAATKIREWGAALSSNRFGSAGAPTMPTGFVPGALPGGMTGPAQVGGPPQWQQQQPPQQPQWPTQAAPPAAPVWPGMPAQPAQAPQTPPTPPWQQAPTAAPMAPQSAPAPTPPAPPAAPAPIGKPACYSQFNKLNGNDVAAQDSPKNPPCVTCVFKVPCIFESPQA